MIAEDARSNITVRDDDFWYDHWQIHDQRIINPLKPFETGELDSADVHNRKINNIERGLVPLSRLGFDSEWDFNFYHII